MSGVQGAFPGLLHLVFPGQGCVGFTLCVSTALAVQGHIALLQGQCHPAPCYPPAGEAWEASHAGFLENCQDREDRKGIGS